MTENYIIIEKVQERELENILMDLANLYADTTFVNGIQLYRKKRDPDSFLVLFTNQPDFERFNYFVNYLKYPSEHENFSPFLRGYYQSKDIKENIKLNVGEYVMVYISKNDKAYDTVNLVTINNENYLYDFGVSIKKLESTEEIYNLISFDKNKYHHIIDIIPSKSSDKIESKPWWKFW